MNAIKESSETRAVGVRQDIASDVMTRTINFKVNGVSFSKLKPEQKNAVSKAMQKVIAEANKVSEDKVTITLSEVSIEVEAEIETNERSIMPFGVVREEISRAIGRHAADMNTNLDPLQGPGDVWQATFEGLSQPRQAEAKASTRTSFGIEGTRRADS